MLKSVPLDKVVFESDSPSMMNNDIYTSEKDYEFYFKEQTKEIEIENNINKLVKYKNHPTSITSLTKRFAELRGIGLNSLLQQIYKNNLKLMKNIL